MRTEDFNHGVVFILLVLGLMFSMILVAPFASSGALIYDPGGENIEVAQGDNFIIRHTLEWDEPESGAYTVTMAWDCYDNHENENFTFVGASAYFTTGDNVGESILAVPTLGSVPSPDYPGSTRYRLKVECPTGNKDNRNGQFNVDITLGAYGAGGVPHIPGDHVIPWQFAGIAIVEKYPQSWNRDPITIRVLGRGVSVSISPSENSGPPAQTLSYTVTVKNTGDLDDNYDLTVGDNENWSPTLDKYRFENIPENENRTTTLRVHIPEDAIGCTRDNITVTATSQGDNTKSDNASCIAHAVPGHVYDFKDNENNKGWEGYQAGETPYNEPPDMTGSYIWPATQSDYDNAENSDDSRWDTTRHREGDYDYQYYKFAIQEDLSTIDNILVHWEGYGSDSPANLFIWENSDGSWDWVKYNSGCSVSESTLENIITSNFGNFIYENTEVGENQFWVAVSSLHPGATCPILYSWTENQRYEYVADTSISGGLGFHGYLNSPFQIPRPEDYVVINELKSVWGTYKLVVGADQNEIYYFDSSKLLAIYHPLGTELYSSTPIYSAPPYPEVKFHTVGNPTPPQSAYLNGSDVLELIESLDGRRTTQATEFAYDTLTLDLGDLSDAGQKKLLMKARQHWVNKPPFVYKIDYAEVPDENGNWIRLENVRVPNWTEHNTRTFAIDITDWFLSDNYMLRLNSWHLNYYDYIAVDTTPDEYMLEIESELTSANLFHKGVSRFEDGVFDYYSTYTEDPYQVFSGNFTRYGDVTELVEETDDKFAIMNPADAIDIQFRKSALEYLLDLVSLFEKDYIFISDSYYKMDFVKMFLGENISKVEPLPFHAMSYYPYPENESFPWDEGHLGWWDEYQTRYIAPNPSAHHTLYTDYVKIEVYYTPPGPQVAWQLIESWTGTVSAPAAWQVVETWTGTVNAPAEWQLIETWTGAVSAPVGWQLIESWTGTVSTPVPAWQLIETWTGTVEAPAVWELIETWTGTVEAPAEWLLIETWIGTVEAPVEWELIETWTGTVQAPAEWQLIETWTGTVEAPAVWQLIETWTGTVNAPAAWQVIETWTGTVSAPAAWQLIESWTGTIEAPAAWQLIETWTGTVEAPAAWQIIETWTGTIEAPAEWQLIETWTGTVEAPAEWQLIETWTETVEAPAEWQLIESWTGTVSAPVPAWQLIEKWTGTVEAPAAWQLVETWTGTVEAPTAWQLIESWTGTVEAPPAAWRLIETWTGTVEAPHAWQLIETWTGTVEAPPAAWRLIETWTGTIEVGLIWHLVETWIGTVEAPTLILPTKPLLYLPLDGSILYDNTPYFEWTKGENAENHRLLVDNDPDFSSPNENRIFCPDIENLKPNADGQYTEWGIDDTTHYGATSDQSDTTWVYSDVDEAKEVLNLDNATILTKYDTINSVTVNVKCRVLGGKGPREKVNLMMRTHDTDYDTDPNMTVADDTFTWIYGTAQTVNPNTTSAWTFAEVRDLEAGLRITAVATGENIQCSEIEVTVDYTPSEEADNFYTIADENALPDDNYSWKVVAINENGENSSNVWTFIVKAAQWQLIETWTGTIQAPVAWTGSAVFSMVNLYTVNVEKILDLYAGSKLVVKFYTYLDAYENENVVETFSPPAHVEENELARHPEGVCVKKARLDFTTDDTENVISTIASYTVRRVDLEARFLEIPFYWSQAPPGSQERLDLEAEFLEIPFYWSQAPD